MNQWKDVSSYSRGEPQECRVPRVWEYRTKRLCVTVHRHRDYDPKVWLLSCPNLDIDNFELSNTEQEDAKKEALNRVRGHLLALLEEIP